MDDLDVKPWGECPTSDLFRMWSINRPSTVPMLRALGKCENLCKDCSSLTLRILPVPLATSFVLKKAFLHQYVLAFPQLARGTTESSPRGMAGPDGRGASSVY